MTYYSDTTEVGFLCGKSPSVIRPAWQKAIDRMIERYAHQGYKGATKVYTIPGDNNTLIALPSIAAAVTSLTEDGNAMATTQYNFFGPSRIIERRNDTFNAYPYYYGPIARTGYFYKDALYVATYTEPTVIPDDWADVANQCVAVYAMFVDKFSVDGIALTISDSGQAGGHGGSVSKGGSTTFPANLMEELKRTIQNGIPRVGV